MTEERFYTVKYGRMQDNGKREETRGMMTLAESCTEYVPPFRVETYFASDSYYVEVVDSKGQRVTDYDSEHCANWLRDYMNAGHHRRESRLQKYCQDCFGPGRAFGVACRVCNGQGALP